ncbi:MAG TPA: hypothetical protein PLR74_14310, partial [Agriterribacter sp.]|nr:hypothetical protein [Agriterribacter sp.]
NAFVTRKMWVSFRPAVAETLVNRKLETNAAFCMRRLSAMNCITSLTVMIMMPEISTINSKFVKGPE